MNRQTWKSKMISVNSVCIFINKFIIYCLHDFNFQYLERYFVTEVYIFTENEWKDC